MLKSELEKLKQEKESNQLKIENFDNAFKSLDKLIGSQIPDKIRKGLGFVSYNVVPPPPTGLFSPPNLDLSNSSLEEFQQPEFEGYGPKTSKSVSEDTSNDVRKSHDASLVKELVLNDKLEKKTANCNYHQKERIVYENNYTKVNYNYSGKKAHPTAHRNIVPRAVLMKTGLRPLNTARPAQSTMKRPYQMRTTLTNKIFYQKVNTAKGKVNTARLKVVNTARPNTAVVNAVRSNQISKNLMKDMLHLGDEPKEGRLLGKFDWGNKSDDGFLLDTRLNTNINTGSLNINTVSPTVSTALLESTFANFFGDESELDLSNIATTYPVPTTPNTRIHKDNSLDHVLGDVQSGRAQEGNPSIKRSKLDRSYARRASTIQITTSLDIIGFTLWLKGQLEQNGCTEIKKMREIEAIRLFLAYALFKDFVVYKMDVKSAFLYCKIKEEEDMSVQPY
ncbi:hypothetical protein Tco_0712875 [Tanacetum coccineum]